MRHVLALLVAVLAVPSSGQEETWTTYVSADGVRDLGVSSDTLWAATNGGLVGIASDGGVVRLDNLSGLGGVDITCLAVGDDGVVWTGTDNGWLSEYVPDSGRVAKYRFREEQEDLILSDIDADDRAVWAATDIGLVLFTLDPRERRETYVHIGTLPEETPIKATVRWGDLIVAGGGGGLAWAPADYVHYNLQNPATWRTTPGSQLPADTVTALAVLGDTLFAGTTSGVARAVFGADTTWAADGFGSRVRQLAVRGSVLTVVASTGVWERGPTGSWTQVALPDTLYSGSQCVADFGGDVWVGTQAKGFVYGAAGDWRTLRLGGPSGQTFSGFSPDATGGLWISTAAPANQRNGVVEFRDGSFTNHRPSLFTGDARNDATRDVQVASDGRVWAATYGGGAIYYDGGEWIEADPAHVVFDVSSPDFVPLTDVAESSGVLWWASYSRGVYATSLDLSTFTKYSTLTGLATDEVFSAAVDQVGRTWIGLRRAGVNVVDWHGTPYDTADDEVGHYTQADDNLSDDTVNEIAVDSSGNVWLGTDRGLTKFDALFSTFFPLAMPEDIGLSIRAIAIDSRNTKWVGTERGLGALSSDDAAWRVYRTDNSGLVDDGVLSLWFDREAGDLWIGTEGGISVLRVSGGGPAEIAELAPYPNPCVVARDGERVNFDERGLLPADSRVDVVTIRGERVRTIDVAGNFGSPVFWDLRNDSGNKVAGGMYVFVVTSSSGERLASGKIAVIR